MLVPSAPLRLLMRLRLRAWWRTLRRRLSTPVGLTFGVLGLALFAVWVYGALSGLTDSARGLAPEDAHGVARGTLAALTAVLGVSALTHRGLYFPADEIERLLSAPLTRSDLVRYRLLVTLAHSGVFSVFLGCGVGLRMPVTSFGVAGGVLALATLPAVGIGIGLACGDAGRRLGRLAARIPEGLLRAGVAALVLAVAIALVQGMEAADVWRRAPWEGAVGWSGTPSPREPLFLRATHHPVLRALTLPVAPWAHAMAARDAREFWPWFGFALALSLALFEGAARFRVDFREQSLATSARVAARISSWRSGRGAISGAGVSRRAASRRVPWLFGRTPLGAVAWLKCCAIVRRSRGTLLFALFATLVASLLAWKAFADALSGAVFVALLGTLYLASGLRFDFRGDLDWMEVVRAWPVRPWKVFLATILPEVLLVCGLVTAAIVVSTAARGEAAWEVGWVLVATPPLCTMWLAIDNALFLIAPVRYVPGQGSAMHHAGRTLILVLARLVLLVVLALACYLSVEVAGLVSDVAGLGPTARLFAMGCAAATTVLAAVVGTIALGAWALARFDVSRHRALAL